ncbi:magnesium/cobalt transporter CorA [Parabacteroides sp. FAFU027]|uniref:magnesium/cobalt transporter CorA n=1 Tax=Parabacteroides sp. FAFU027 TaxID=2922715 RepID=UPI001FAF59F8|nr:magnesium/cobalt transporter CorA [Parabacteroides sp. FAFU027]
MDNIVNCASYANGKRIENLKLEDISEVLAKEDQFVWLGLRDPDEALMKQLQEEFGLHELAIEDAHRAHQRPKIESYGDILFIVMRAIALDENNNQVEIGETHFFLGQNFLVSIRHRSSLTFVDVRSRCETTPHLLQKGPGFVLYAIMDYIVDQYFPVIDFLSEELDKLEDQIFAEKLNTNITENIYRLKSKLIEIKRVSFPLIDICNKLMRFDTDPLIHDDIKLYFRDIYDHAVRINEMIDSAKEQLTSALEANLSLTSIYQNEISKKFAGWAAIIGIPTMMAGIYGMNFEYMPELHWRYGYPAILFFIIGLCMVLYWFFKRSKWL